MHIVIIVDFTEFFIEKSFYQHREYFFLTPPAVRRWSKEKGTLIIMIGYD
jgi:hypothetical protein